MDDTCFHSSTSDSDSLVDQVDLISTDLDKSSIDSGLLTSNSESFVMTSDYPNSLDDSQSIHDKTATETQFEDVHVDDESTLSIDGGVVEKIVSMTCREIDGILQMKGSLISSIQEGFRGSDQKKGVSVEMAGDDACTVNISIIMEFGKSAPRIFQEIHDKVTSTVATMTGLHVTAVNVRVTNVMTKAEAESGRRREKTED